MSFFELEFFLSLYRLRSITDTAKKFGLTVPAASRTLKKLRITLADPLFVRSNPYFLPSDRAHALAGVVEKILSNMRELAAPENFDPKTLKQTFRIAAVDNAVLIVLNNFIRAFYQICPCAVLEFQYVDTELFKKLENGEVDVAVYPSTCPVPARMHERNFYEARYRLCVRQDHPLVQYWHEHGVVPISEISRYRKIVITDHLDAEGQTYSLDESAILGIRHQEVGLSLPYFTPIPSILANTDLTVLLPEETAKMLKNYGTGIAILPYGEESEKFSYWTRLIWHERTHSDMVMQWFRSLFSYIVDETLFKK